MRRACGEGGRSYLGRSALLSRTRRRIAPQAIDRFKARVRGLDATHGRTEPLAGRQGAVVLSRWVARLLWLLRDPFSTARPRPVDQATAARHRLEAVEAWAYPLCEAATPRRRPGSGGTNRR